MNPTVESAFISAGATIVSVLATATVAIVGVRNARSTNQAAIDAAAAAADKTVNAARDTNRATIDAAQADVRQTLDATREGQIADRYTKAIEQVGSGTIYVAIGGIYALERIARDSSRDHPTVMEVLSACVRQYRDQWPKPDPDGTTHEQSPRPDIQAALTVIGRRDAQHDIQPIDLTGANLTGADLGGAELSKAYLSGADLISANLVGAKLTGAHLDNAKLTRADLRLADLTEADLSGANLTSAQLDDARLTDARLARATLTQAKWPIGTPVPAHWRLDTSSGRLEWQGADSGPTEAT